MVGDTRQGWALLAAMLVVLMVFAWWRTGLRQTGNLLLAALGIDQTSTEHNPGGNMEGKETRFGIARSALFAPSPQPPHVGQWMPCTTRSHPSVGSSLCC